MNQDGRAEASGASIAMTTPTLTSQREGTLTTKSRCKCAKLFWSGLIAN
ncbi:MAG: hypothetical protein WCJ66_15250 [Verrucomicrobiota bacterium]